MRHRLSALAVLVGLLVAGATPVWSASHTLGIGAMYWEAIDDVVSSGFEIEDSGLAGVLSYQYQPTGIFSLELDLEFFPDGFNGSTDTAVSPVAFLLLGHGLYGGVGIGVTISDGLDDSVSDPFYAARVGWNFHIIPKISFDININYRANTFKGLEDVDSDLVTLGGFVRFDL